MKKATSILFLGITVAVIAGISPLKWNKTSIDLGQVTKGESKDLSFEFTNTSEEPVNILEAKGSCGCTNVQYPKEAINPGQKAVITASFKSGKVGDFKKNIRIKTSESDTYEYLYFSGEVVE
ncbi:MAG: DUF1573 domain-containing protein [Bacteroidota bacterium]